MAQFERTYCSQCGGKFGPGDQGYSHCDDHDWEHPCPFRGEPTMTPSGEACSACGLRESAINDTAATQPQGKEEPK